MVVADIHTPTPYCIAQRRPKDAGMREGETEAAEAFPVRARDTDNDSDETRP